MTTGEDGTYIPVDTVFELLANPRRRAVLRILPTTGEMTLRALSTAVAARENGLDADQLSTQQRKRVSIALHQHHLPKLDSGGVVGFDRDRGTVVRTPRATQLDPFLELAATHER